MRGAGPALAALAACVASTMAGAQPVAPAGGGVPAPPASRLRPELRVDGFAGHASGAQLGVGVSTDAGTYARFVVLAAAGAERRRGGAITGVQRVEGVMRFHVDPFRESSLGWYVAGGMAVRHATGAPVRPLVVALLGIEGAPRRGAAMALEAGFGGGVRVGLALRRSRRDRR